MKTLILIGTMIAIAVVAGCMMPTSEPAPAGQPNEEASFGDTPIIRPGMERNEVETLLGEQGLGTYIDAASYAPAVFAYADAGLKIIYIADKVESCRTTTTVVSGPYQRETISDSALKQLLRPGMTPNDAAAKLGQPKCGFENMPGRVVLIYGKDIEATFVDFALNQWRRTTYSVDRRVIYSAEKK